MRLFYLILLSFLLCAAPALAQTNFTPIFGSYTCSQPVPCSDSVSADQWAAYGNACLVRAFGASNPDDFDETAGVDSSGCLTAKQVPSPNGSAKHILPKCCVITRPDNSCVFHCDLLKE